MDTSDRDLHEAASVGLAGRFAPYRIREGNGRSDRGHVALRELWRRFGPERASFSGLLRVSMGPRRGRFQDVKAVPATESAEPGGLKGLPAHNLAGPVCQHRLEIGRCGIRAKVP